MDDEQAPNRRMRESEKVPVAEGILCERHGISITDAVILLAAMTAARGTTATALASRSSTRRSIPARTRCPTGFRSSTPPTEPGRTEA